MSSTATQICRLFQVVLRGAFNYNSACIQFLSIDSVCYNFGLIYLALLKVLMFLGLYLTLTLLLVNGKLLVHISQYIF